MEVLLAFVVFAISIAVVMQIMASSTRGTVRAREDTEVAMLVQSVMGVVGTDIPLEAGSFDGDALDKYQWTLQISPMEDGGDAVDLIALAEQTGISLFNVQLEVYWDNGIRERNEYFSTIRGRVVGAP